jgi:hypothetical protein
MYVDVLSCGRRNEWGDNEVDIGDQEEDSDRERGADRRVPLFRVAVHGEGVQVEVNEASCYEYVDDGQGIGDQTEH